MRFAAWIGGRLAGGRERSGDGVAGLESVDDAGALSRAGPARAREQIE